MTQPSPTPRPTAPRNLQKHFSHLYVEAGVCDAWLTQRAIEKFPKATIVEIDNYRDMFNRPNQDFQLQKQSKNLILARKRDHLLYPGNDKVQDFGYQNFHYNTLLLNCIYNCAYCYLQGMFQSANLVAFVNEADYFAATQRAIAQRKDKSSPLYLAISYDTDLLGFENVLPYCERWIAFCKTEPDLIIEIRTKSANIAALKKHTPHPGVVLAWTLSPQSVIDAYEQDTPSLEQRLKSLVQAIDAGWRIRLCFDPVLHVMDWQAIYQKFFDAIFARIDPHSIHDVSLGLFRMNSAYFNQLKKNRPDTDLIFQHYHCDHQVLTLPTDKRQAMIAALTAMLTRYFPADKLGVWN